MPGSLENAGGVTKAMLAALDDMHKAITASLVNPDGSPSQTAVYMHLPVGLPIDPKMYANPWTPAGGSAYAQATNTGGFAAPPMPQVTTETAPPPAAQAAAAITAPQPDPKLQQALNSAFHTSRRVDNMLMVTKNGVAVSWPQRTVSIEYFIALEGMEAEELPEPSEEDKKRIADAEGVLYLKDAEGNFTGYTPLHTMYRRNAKLLADARAAFALAYAQAMADPVAGQAWPVTSSQYQLAIDQAYDDLKSMGGQRIEDALDTLQSLGGNAAASLIAQARKLFEAYNVGLAGAIGTKLPWSYIEPVSWWDHTNKDFGAMKITASSTSYSASGAEGAHDFSSSFYENSSSSTSGSVGFNFVFGASANGGYSTSDSTTGGHQESSGWNRHEDKSSSATISFEWFLASIERPWLLGDLFHLPGWYMKGHKAGAISDGTIDGQLGDTPKLLPMLPKGFVVIRNVSITTDDWGSMGDSLREASSNQAGHTETESTSYGGSVGFMGWGGSVQHNDSSSSGAFSGGADSSSGWNFKSDGKGGTLTINGAQIVGWIGQIQPKAPRLDDPGLNKPAEEPKDEEKPKDEAQPVPVPEPGPAPEPVPAPGG